MQHYLKKTLAEDLIFSCSHSHLAKMFIKSGIASLLTMRNDF